MSGTAENNADVRSAPSSINHHELSVSRTKALLAHKLAHFQTRIHPRQSADLDLLNWLVDSQRQPLNLKMHITDEEAAELKAWIVKKLENISDADSDVLADYVLALIRVDTEEAELKINAIDSLEDFLKDDTAAFVYEVFHAVRTRSYKAGYVPPLDVPSYNPPLSAPSGPSGAYGSLGAGRGSSGEFQESKKRSYNDHQENGSRGDSHYARGDRQIKQLRRGGRGGRENGFGNRGGRGGFQDPGYSFPHAVSPQLPPTFPNMSMPAGLPFDPNDPMAAIMAMQAMGLPPLPGMPTLCGAASPEGPHQFGGQGSPGFAGSGRRERCRDYDTQGYCARGDSCPYEHGTDRLIAPNQDEYDPKNALLSAQPTSPVSNGHISFNAPRGNTPARGSGRGRGDRGAFPPRKTNRAEFSQAGPNHDRSITTIVVEQIPEERFDEQSVRGFFSEFGNIVEVTMQPYKRLALVEYDDYTGARIAYDSPKVIFDNRFVKVYWYNPNTLPTPPAAGKDSSESSRPKEEGQSFDKEGFERNAMAAQKKLDEKKAQMKEMEAKRQALEKQKEELALKQAEEKRRLLEKLAAKGITDGDTTMTDSTTNGTNRADDSKASAHTKALRQKVAELEAEAKSLGLDSALSDYTPRGRGRGRGRGSYRGWEGFAGRGGVFDSPRGRGGFRGRGGGKYNLDNRTKKVVVSGVEFDAKKDEALRSYLLGVGEYSAIEPHPDSSDAQIITFKDRPTAENFMYGTKAIPNVGKPELNWHNAPSASLQAAVKQAGTGGDVGMGGMNADNGETHRSMPVEDYDIAEDYDVADDVS